MALEVHALLFPSAVYSSPRAKAWASLHGFDHPTAEREGPWIRVEHMPRRLFDPTSLHPLILDPNDGIRAVAGRVVRRSPRASDRLVYLDTDQERDRYEQFSERLRRRAFIGDTRVTSLAPADGNEDIASWYERWFVRTHEGAGEDEWRVAEAILHGLRQASRDHALDYARKLGYARVVRG